MLRRHSKGQPAQVIFTQDFHELVRGEPIQDLCVFCYDPFRLVPASDFASPLPVTVSVVLRPSGARLEQTLAYPGVELQKFLSDSTGQGTMLKTALPLPPDTTELECWFTYTDRQGKVHYDSDYGKNYRIRFPLLDIEYISTGLDMGPGGTKPSLTIEAKTVPDVTSLAVRWRFTCVGMNCRRITSALKARRTSSGLFWSTNPKIELPEGATIAFDIVYVVDGFTFTDDNEGSWYLATADSAHLSGVGG